MSSEDNKALVRRFFDEVVNGGNIDLIDELLTDDFVEHEKFPGLEPNRDGVKEFFRRFRSAFPDGSFTPEEMIAEGDTVAVRVTIRGTHQGEFVGLPATGKSVEVAAIDFIHCRDGRMTAHWGVGDMLSMMQQLGAVPTPGA